MQKTVCQFLVSVPRNLWQKLLVLKKTDLRLNLAVLMSVLSRETKIFAMNMIDFTRNMEIMVV